MIIWKVSSAVVSILVCLRCSCLAVEPSALRHIRLLNGHFVSGRATEISRTTGSGLTMIRCAAVCQEGCGVFHFHRVTKLCVIFSEKQYQVELTSDPDWDIGYKQYPREYVTMDGNWTLVFRLQAATSVPAYDTWVNDGQQDDSPLFGSFPLACLRMFDYASCDRHFRSHVLDNWNGISEVYLSVVKNESEVAFIQFDGKGSNRMSWFGKYRVTNSTWLPGLQNYTDLQPGTTIYGSCNTIFCRRFMFHRKYAGCRLDTFYFMVIDYSFDDCDYVKGEYKIPGPPPTIQYSPISGYASFSVGRGDVQLGEYADVMAVYVKFE